MVLNNKKINPQLQEIAEDTQEEEKSELSELLDIHENGIGLTDEQKVRAYRLTSNPEYTKDDYGNFIKCGKCLDYSIYNTGLCRRHVEEKLNKTYAE